MATKITPFFTASLRALRPRTTSSTTPLSRYTAASLRSPRHITPASVRLAHSIPRPSQPTPRDANPSTAKSESARPAPPPANRPSYQLSFTCVPCGHRSHHNISKQGYHTGSTLITCPECRNRHVISDHLGIFGDTKGMTVEDIVKKNGGLVKKGSLGEDGDIEFWPDENDDLKG
ncbi:DNL zinc finger domain-containing protein [Emericellopsis atlantica]|uniref:DNL zinc finger domain-containing protein n=1 Tax=Emericellopsis atlantica TaxID=2614577 RepID=A0A9P8CSE0_9HYPO|nr:DNL zinc finger domain-containing protein [Emericellopsis atlantica]KAG9257984.1 DNL zinc finger domain-containing protein [Emericellopsis atlantica]